MTVHDQLTEVVARVLDLRRSEPKISPAWVATEAMHLVDPARAGPELEYFGCHLYLRQIARMLLRKRFEPDDPNEAQQHELWPDLQAHYPEARSANAEEPVYVRLELLTDEDIAYNVARLRSEANAKLRHADALEAYGRDRPRGAASA